MFGPVDLEGKSPVGAGFLPVVRASVSTRRPTGVITSEEAP
jgi:hypothetical protein